LKKWLGDEPAGDSEQTLVEKMKVLRQKKRSAEEIGKT